MVEAANDGKDRILLQTELENVGILSQEMAYSDRKMSQFLMDNRILAVNSLIIKL